jgi:hypothetical protein
MADRASAVGCFRVHGEASQSFNSAILRANSSALNSTGIARQTFSNPGKFQRLGKSLHCCGFTGCTAQLSPSRKMHSPFAFSCNASPCRSLRNRVNCWIKSCSVIPLNAASREISASVNRTCPGQRQQAVQRWHSRKIGTPQKYPEAIASSSYDLERGSVTRSNRAS